VVFNRILRFFHKSAEMGGFPPLFGFFSKKKQKNCGFPPKKSFGQISGLNDQLWTVFQNMPKTGCLPPILMVFRKFRQMGYFPPLMKNNCLKMCRTNCSCIMCITLLFLSEFKNMNFTSPWTHLCFGVYLKDEIISETYLLKPRVITKLRLKELLYSCAINRRDMLLVCSVNLYETYLQRTRNYDRIGNYKGRMDSWSFSWTLYLSRSCISLQNVRVESYERAKKLLYLSLSWILVLVYFRVFYCVLGFFKFYPCFYLILVRFACAKGFFPLQCTPSRTLHTHQDPRTVACATVDIYCFAAR